MVFDTAYTYDIMKERNISTLVTAKDINGYFDHVWTVHAVASLFYPLSSKLRYGRPVVRKLNKRHTHIEGKIGCFHSLSWFPVLNFILAQIELIFFLIKLNKKNQMSIIRAEDPIFNGILGLIISTIKRLPIIIGVWGNNDAIRKDTKKTLSPYFKWIWLERLVEKFVLRRADTALAGNYNNMDYVINYGVKKEKTAVIRIGPAIYAPHFVEPNQRECGIADLRSLGVNDEKVLLCISRLENLKRSDHMIKALSCLKDKNLKIKALFVGDGEARVAHAKLAKELGVSDQIIFCGNKDQDWLYRVIPCAAVVVSPLTGRSLVEAALGGAPIAAYDIDWQNEIIEQGVTGELVPYLNYSLLANSIEKILKDEIYAYQIGTNVREKTLKMMDPEKINNVLIDTYEKLLTKKTPYL